MTFLFKEGSVWRHKATGFTIKIEEPCGPDRFRVSSFQNGGGIIVRLLCLEPWTASELLRDFELVDPNVPLNRYTQLMEDD